MSKEVGAGGRFDIFLDPASYNTAFRCTFPLSTQIINTCLVDDVIYSLNLLARLHLCYLEMI